MGRGPAQPAAFPLVHAPARPTRFSNLSVRFGPAYDIGGEAHVTRALYGPARRFDGPAR